MSLDNPEPLMKSKLELLLNQAQIARTDIYHFEPKSRGALAYEAFAMEIMRYGR